MPVRQSVVPNVVPREDMLNAMALNSAGFNITRIVEPTLAGILIARVGDGENFYIQAVAHAGVALMVVQLQLPAVARAASKSFADGLRDGTSFVWHHPPLRTQMTLALVPLVIALPYTAPLPVFATDVLHKGAGGFGLMMAAPGISAVLATLTLASLGNVRRKGPMLLGAVFALGVSLILFSLSRSFVLSLLLLAVVGGTQMFYMTTNQTVLQLTAPDELRGRVMGIYMLNQGLLPLGSLFAGTVADLFNAPVAGVTMGALVALMAVLFALRAPQHPHAPARLPATSGGARA
ncbi:MAG: MFS transporter [Chloroflexi bacterium]|nr:MFS transporter [Chloroflexota bacterium]